jgi:acyl carrier protein
MAGRGRLYRHLTTSSTAGRSSQFKVSDESTMMDTSAIYARLTPIFREVFDDDTITPHTGMTAAEVPAWDSLSNIRLVVAVEQAFKIQFTTGEVAGLKNVGEFVSVIKERSVA